MNLFRSLMGRRQFLFTSLITTLMLALGRFFKVFDFLLQEGTASASTKTDTAGKRPLKAIVVYYSATGSTGKVAGAIYRGMKSVMDCDIAPIKKIDPKIMDKYDVVAIGGPIWYYRETANLRLFIYKMPNMAGKLCIPFCSHGTQPSGFFYSLNQALQKKDFTIIGWHDWYGGASHVLHMPKPYVTDGHPDEIDLKEAEAFGKEMAERAMKITAGERKLIPAVPTSPDADPLWIKSGIGGPGGGGMLMGATVVGGSDDTPTAGNGSSGGASGVGMPGPGGGAREPAGGGMPASIAVSGAPGGPGGPGGGGGMQVSESVPRIDTSKCVYPRCTACVDNCVANAIDLSMAAPAGSLSGSLIFIKGCQHCGTPLCERSCAYDALIYESTSKTKHVIDRKKCTYPKCTLCIDNCPMNSIDFSNDQPVFHNNCEGCDLCWCICPVDAISITNIPDTHAKLESSETGPDSPFLVNLNMAEKTGRFRRLVPLDKVGWGKVVYKNPHAPRVVLHPEDYPYAVKG